MVIDRQAIRAILLTPQNEVLLMRIRIPDTPLPFWICPGGGMEAGERPEIALQRELQEELGLASFELGPLVWRRRHTFNFSGKRLCQTEGYHIVQVEKFEPVISDPVEMQVFQKFHWWSLSEMKSSNERVTPLSLVKIIEDFLKYGAPRGELELEVLVD